MNEDISKVNSYTLDLQNVLLKNVLVYPKITK